MAVHYEDEGVRIHKIVASPYNNNAYIIVCKSTGKSLIIDTPRDADLVLAEAAGTDVTAVAITHGHRDHIEGYDAFRAGLTAPFGLHRDDTPRLEPHAPEFFLEDGESLQVGELSLELLHTPGHTPGGVCLLLGVHLFSGDTLFPGGPGKTQNPEALRQVIESITGRLLTLPDETAVYPGHGADTTIGAAKEEYADFASRPHAPRPLRRRPLARPSVGAIRESPVPPSGGTPALRRDPRARHQPRPHRPRRLSGNARQTSVQRPPDTPFSASDTARLHRIREALRKPLQKVAFCRGFSYNVGGLWCRSRKAAPDRGPVPATQR